VDQFHEGLPTLAQAERNLIERALRLTGGNQTRAAQILGIERRRLYRKVRAYKLAPLGPTPGE
jgi:DNA-binding NtrC family response regulator